MQKERLTLKLPMEPLALRHAGEMLLAMGAEMTGDTTVTVTLKDNADLPPPAADLPPPAADLPPPAADLPPPAVVGVVLDDAKRPWDNRIHGSGKTFLKTGDRAGCWKYKKQLDPALIASVEAELDAAMAAPAAAPPALPPAAVPPAALPPAAVPPAAVPPAPVDTGAAPAMDFAGVVKKVTALQNEGRITPEQIQAIITAAGLPSFPLLGSRLDLIPAVNVEIDKLCPPTQ